MELLSPANTATLDAALDAGADAVYFGLKRLNARAGALNFSQEELPAAVERIHAHGAKAHLTLNIDLETREVALALRTLQCALQAGVDAVIVRDPAVLAMRRLFPGLEFHFSTQCGVSTSAGVRAARRLGCDRAVLAREMTGAEIAAASNEDAIATEVFIQGAMCFCVSGRCLLSSWVGGRSGNRGACASPCRVAWKSGDGTCHPMSMHDLCLIGHLEELRKAGVASLKIEGRLKSAPWVTKAVSLYRQALDNPSEADRPAADELGRYTGRELTDGYFTGCLEGLTGEAAGRSAGSCSGGATSPAAPAAPPPHLTVKVRQDEQGGTCLDLGFGKTAECYRIPPQRVVKANRAVSLEEMLETALEGTPPDTELVCDDDMAALLLPRRCASGIADAISDFQRRAKKPDDDGTVRIPLDKEVQRELAALLAEGDPEKNRLHLGDIFDRIRIGLSQIVILPQIAEALQGRRLQLEVMLDRRCTPGELRGLLADLPGTFQGKPVVIGLPQVCHEADLPELSSILRECAANSMHLVAQLNSWDTWQLAMENGLAAFEGGEGLAVLNPAAANFLSRQGFTCVAVSPEADRGKLETLTEHCGTALSLTTFGRPALMTTRAQLPDGYAPGTAEGSSGPVFADGRGIELQATRERGLTILRPLQPFDWRRIANQTIRTAHLVCDLRGTRRPSDEIATPAPNPFLFNYDRTLR